MLFYLPLRRISSKSKSPETTRLRCDMVFVCLKRKMSWCSELVQNIPHVFWSSKICLREKTPADLIDPGVGCADSRSGKKSPLFGKVPSLVGLGWFRLPPKRIGIKCCVCLIRMPPVFGSTYYILVTRLCEYMSFESSFSWGVYGCFSFFAALGIEPKFPFDKGYQLFCSD